MLRFHVAISLDGYVAGPDQREESPLGVGGMRLHEWVFDLEAWRRSQGMEGGDVNASTPVIEESQANVGATIMGRNMFGPIRGPWNDSEWNGWWGDDPPFHTPVYVLTHHARDPVEMKGGTTVRLRDRRDRVRAAAGGGGRRRPGRAHRRRRAPSGSTWRRGRSTSSSCTSSRSWSAAASGCSTTSATSGSKRCASSRRPASPT